MTNDSFFVLAFNSTSHSIQTEKKAKELFSLSVIPTPRELTNDCGLAIKFLSGSQEQLTAFTSSLSIPADLYCIWQKKAVNGLRKIQKIAQSNACFTDDEQ